MVATTSRSIDADHRGRVRASVAQAAPILANQRNLMLAEKRAASDALTGLPNRRAAVETLHRMSAHAGRSVSHLAAILLGLSAVTGMITLVSFRARRRSGFIVAGLGVVSIVALYLIWVPQ